MSLLFYVCVGIGFVVDLRKVLYYTGITVSIMYLSVHVPGLCPEDRSVLMTIKYC